MGTGELITAIVVFVIAGILLVLSILHFMERGVLFNNAYIYASKEKRETMDKKPHYRQSAIIFCLLSVAFVITGVSVLLRNYMLELLIIPVLVGALVYAVVSSVLIAKKERGV